MESEANPPIKKGAHKRGIAFRSKLQPHWPQIKAWREGDTTWREIVEKLAALGVTTYESNVHVFYKRKMKNAARALGLQPYPTDPPPTIESPLAP